jgi:hypothetical protein
MTECVFPLFGLRFFLLLRVNYGLHVVRGLILCACGDINPRRFGRGYPLHFRPLNLYVDLPMLPYVGRRTEDYLCSFLCIDNFHGAIRRNCWVNEITVMHS